jgi:hypothetical protein
MGQQGWKASYLAGPVSKPAQQPSIITDGRSGKNRNNYNTYLVNVSVNIRSNPPKKNPAATARAMTTTVNRAVSSLLGHTDFLSSETVSRKKATGLTLPPAPGEIIRAALVDALAIAVYLTSLWAVWPRQREQYLRSSKRLGSLRRFFVEV